MSDRDFLIKDITKLVTSICFKVFRLLFLAGVSYVVLFPILKIISTSLTMPEDYLAGNVEWIPSDPTFMNFVNSLEYFKYFNYAWVTIQLTVVSTLIQLITCSVVGYGLARYSFKGRNLVFMAVIFTIIMPIQTAQIPVYFYYRNFDFFGIGSLIGLVTGTPWKVSLIGTNWSYYVPAMFGVGLNSGLFIFLFRQFFSSMPKDLEDAGKVDGCNPLMIYLKIMVPNIKPVFVTVALLSSIYYWNDSLIAGMFMNLSDKKTLMTAVHTVRTRTVGMNGVGVAKIEVEFYAVLLMVVAPLMIIFVVCQKFFVECMDRSGIKG